MPRSKHHLTPRRSTYILLYLLISNQYVVVFHRRPNTQRYTHRYSILPQYSKSPINPDTYHCSDGDSSSPSLCPTFAPFWPKIPEIQAGEEIEADGTSYDTRTSCVTAAISEQLCPADCLLSSL
ncbi:hypothetical protein KC19_5G184100 [Ceratodon purpureus]|uniref:Uncharacterized protein n=1 Tax=Ceratodon purpureus TaxID=3225 RepID=A0A8T0I2Z5_CERPU|nr:hypothetical protein KC19_5G184100 [Ceratodon purpureus]